MSLVRLIARPMLATSFVAAGVGRLRTTEETAEQLRPYLQKLEQMVPSAAALAGNERLVARSIGATQLVAGLLLGMGKFSRLAALVLAGTSSVNALVEFNAGDSSTPDARAHRRSKLLKNLSLVGGVLLAAVDTAGRPGLAWRAGHLTHDAKKNVKSLGHDAKKQLKKADKAVRSAASDVVGS